MESKKDIHKSYRSKFINIKIDNTNYLALILRDFDKSNEGELIQSIIKKSGFDAVAGMSELKKMLTENVILPLKHPDKFIRFGISIPNGILLYGPPGCGKTFIVKKLAEELGYKYLEIIPSSVATPFIHGSVSNVANIFKEAKENSPSIIFIDEIDGLIPKRSDLSSYSDIRREEVNEFLVQLNDAGKHKVLVVGATNQTELLDEALMRPGRFDKKIFVGPPDLKARIELLKFFINGKPYSRNIDFTKISELTDAFSIADLELLIVESARKAIFSRLNEITEDMIVEAIGVFRN